MSSLTLGGWAGRRADLWLPGAGECLKGFRQDTRPLGLGPPPGTSRAWGPPARAPRISLHRGRLHCSPTAFHALCQAALPPGESLDARKEARPTPGASVQLTTFPFALEACVSPAGTWGTCIPPGSEALSCSPPRWPACPTCNWDGIGLGSNPRGYSTSWLCGVRQVKTQSLHLSSGPRTRRHADTRQT